MTRVFIILLSVAFVAWSAQYPFYMFWFCASLVMWFAFIVGYSLKKAPKPWSYLYYPIALVGYPYDIILNVTLGSVLFLELPDLKGKRYMLSQRMKDIIAYYEFTRGSYYKNYGVIERYRYVVAKFICTKMLHPIDGGHCD